MTKFAVDAPFLITLSKIIFDLHHEQLELLYYKMNFQLLL